MKPSLLFCIISFILMTASQSLHNVAVIGAGASGLAAARILSRNGLAPTVLEQSSQIGGVWDYKISSSSHPMYRGLRTNLPREIMAFREKKWTRGSKSFVTHQEVLKYLQDYKDDFDLERFIQHNCKVTQLTVLSDTESSVQTPEGEVWPKIRLEWQSDSRKCCQDFDAVCICNGHYSRPSTPSLPGMQYFQGTTLHSIAYDDPKVFQNQTVLCIGGRASGSDLARELALYAKHVYLSDSTADQVETQDNITCVPRTVGIDKDGRAQFDKCPVTPQVDYIIFCTGYDYDFTFINKQSHLNLTVGDRRVMPLYKQLWHAEFPNVCFVGLPHSVLPFPLFELQLEAAVEQWIQGGKIPALLERFRQAQRDAMEGGVLRSGRIQDTHFLGGAQWDYCREMAKIADLYDEHVENYISTNRAIWDHSGRERKSLFPGAPDIYRDTLYQRSNSDFQVLYSEFDSDPISATQ